MESPQVWGFKDREPFFSVQEYAQIPLNITRKLQFNHIVTVVLPNTLNIPKTVTESASSNSEYYKVDLEPSVLLNKVFLANFIRSGSLVLLSVGTRLDCDDSLALTSEGRLILRVGKTVYQQLGVQGKLSHFSKKSGDVYVINMNLKDELLRPEKQSYKKLQKCLGGLPKFTVIVHWTPPSEDICPSSVAKFLVDRGYAVKLCSQRYKPRLISAKTPLDRADFVDFIEWLGMLIIDADLGGNEDGFVNSYEVPEPCSESGPIQILQWTGFFLPQHITKLLKALNSAKTEGWIALCVHGFSDSPIGWDGYENNHFLDGDNGYILVIDHAKGLVCSYGCCRRILK